MAKEEFSLDDAIGRHERHARAQLETHISEYQGYYAKKGEEPQEITDVIRGKFSSMMGYIGGKFEQLELNYKWADKKIKADDISDEYKLFEFTKKFAKALGHDIGDYDISTEDGKDRMRSTILNLIKATGGFRDEEAQAKIKELIDSKGESDDAINYIKAALRGTQRSNIINNAFNRYDINLTADEALQFSAALRAYEHEMSGRTVRKDYKALAGSKEDRQKEFGTIYDTLFHPQNSLFGKADDTERVVGQYKPHKYKPK